MVYSNTKIGFVPDGLWAESPVEDLEAAPGKSSPEEEVLVGMCTMPNNWLPATVIATIPTNEFHSPSRS